jgi:glycine/serine hydroxymethyltransferase
MTTRWVREEDTRKIVDFIHRALQCYSEWNEKSKKQKLESIKQEVIEFSKKFPVPSL